MAEVYVISHLQGGKQLTDEHKHETQWPSGLCQRIPRKQLSWHGNYQYTSQVSLSPSEHEGLPHLMISVLNPGSSEIQNTEHHYSYEDHFPPFYKHLLLKHQISRAKFKNRCFENCIHTVPGNSETCKVFPGQFMPDVSGWDVCMWSLCTWGDLNEWGSMGGDRQSTHGAQLGFWSFNSFTPLTLLPSSDWRQVQNI